MHNRYLKYSSSILKKKQLLFNLIILATAYSPFIGTGGINNLLIGVMILSIVINFKVFLKPRKKDWLLYVFPLTLLLTNLLNISSFRSSSYLYGLLFILFFLTNLHLIRTSKLAIDEYKKFIKILIYSYFVVLVIQQIMYIAGINNFLNKIFVIGIKFNSLATEPSYAAIIIVVLFYSYIFTTRLQNNAKYGYLNFRKDGTLWFVFAYQMLTIGSSFGILLSGLFLFTFIKKPLHSISILLLIVLMYYIGLTYEFIPLVRLNSVLQTLNLFNPDFSLLEEVDHSAAVRLVPTIMAIQSLEFYRLFGMGMDFSANYFPSVIKGVEAGTFGGGLLPSFLIDNGIINSIILILIIKAKAIQEFFSFGFLMFVIILINTSFNSQLFWISLTILSINVHFNNTIPSDVKKKF